MGEKEKWSWRSALIGAATATATAAIILGRPKDPTFHLISIKPKSFKLNLPIVDADLILTVHVTNPNIVPIKYSSSSMSIFYDGSLLGSAQILAGVHPPKSCKLLKLPARLRLSPHASKLLSDVARRELVLDAAVDIGGIAKVLWWDHRFKVHVDSHFIVDPVFLDVLDQENRSSLRLFSG
ncbi:Late embryogenesis abundant protein [Macleaya cordata]|uniref:Late embryogenesis abundant protein n=1 Tax=Macleaya cordata TaxID=56857 RepID=A0A200Q6F8_MACCD|nr:Late embryogenesis abundant protein [Macleaya cordata]